MPLAPQGTAQVPNFWNVYGHSYFMHAFGTRTQAGRADSLFRNLLNVDHTSFANLAATGSRLTQEGNSAGGYVRLLQNVTGFEINLGSAFTAGGAPQPGGGGGFFFGGGGEEPWGQTPNQPGRIRLRAGGWGGGSPAAPTR